MVPVEKKLSAQQFVICLEHGMLVLTVPAKLTANDRRRIKCLVELVLMDDDIAVNDYLGAEHFADLASKEDDKWLTMPPEHDKRGNCLAESTVFGCPECSPNSCDVCHYHDEPRGECGECPACLECGGSDDDE